ncbi:VirB4 family type IV secretion/conjugal transfer ATPase [Paraburkholderia phytofirmans]|uniref:CagE TrbE VirB component of type IV transporter system n=1 Tax=Paraburkholderia phytofirmans (strain DSM 17436 / LMG 22146 / PsJN) TaxID=398527 RepID=B2TH83_PARPJ|nr:hypothetical protein [Paraburkholderia phytofirmans]ACD21632.1 CagE TrbE VirB component of type IV transporter system [Paraburkholderia phytofirmans PsJN]
MTVYDELIAKEEPATKYIPYSKQITPTTCTTVERDLTRTIRCDGVPFETMSDEELNGFTRSWFAAINTLGANNNRVALWSHVVRSKLRYDLSGIKYDNYFSQLFGDQIAERVGKKTFFQNELFLSPVYRPAPGRAERIGAALDKQGGSDVLAAARDEIDRITNQLVRSLRRYNPSVLGVEEFDGEKPAISHLQAFYGRLLNADVGPVPLDSYSVRFAIQRNELHFGREIIEIEGPVSSRYAGVVGLKAPYGAENAKVNIFHGLLRLPYEFVLSQSLTFLPLNKADKFLQTQISQFSSTDANSLQLKELKDARERLQAGKFGMCEHEFILTIYGDSIEEVNEGINEVIAVFEEKNLTLIRKKRGKLITQYFGMLPGNFLTGRLDAMPVSTDNFAAFFPLHNFFTGNAEGSQWGSPIALMESTSNGPIFMNYHVSRRRLRNQEVRLEYTPEENEEDEEDEQAEQEGIITPKRKAHKKELGNYQVIGPSGSGKTLTKLMLRTLMRKVRPGKGMKPFKTFAWDKDYGEEILVNALGGVYFRLEDGKPTGLNPYALQNNEVNCQFIHELFMWCACKDPAYLRTGDDDKILSDVIQDVYKLPEHLRRPARMMDTLPGSSSAVQGPGGARIVSLKAALVRWVEGGQYSWVLDNSRDLFDLTRANDFGFDMTKFLNNDFARTPIQLLINHKIDLSVDGNPFVLDIAEAWKALKDPFMQEFIGDKAKTVRKLQGIIGLDTQDPTDLSTSPIRGTLLQQFPTQIILPNDRAKREDYVEGLGLTDREYSLVREGMLDEPGKFLFKQGNDSVVVRNDLGGMDDMIAVLSASIDNVPLVRELIEAHGNKPEIWLPQFFRQRV